MLTHLGIIESSIEESQGHALRAQAAKSNLDRIKVGLGLNLVTLDKPCKTRSKQPCGVLQEDDTARNER